MARHLVEAKQSMAMLTTFNAIDLSTLPQLRRDYREAVAQEHGARLGLMSFFVRVAIVGRPGFPG